MLPPLPHAVALSRIVPNVLTCNGGHPISCDDTSIFFGDLAGLPEIPCKIAELKDRPSTSEHKRMMKEERDEK
jgi:hypothetical protein